MKEMHEHKGLSISYACALFGHCRQAYYQQQTDYRSRRRTEREIVAAAKEQREQAPGIGCVKLYLILLSIFGREQMMGRDSFLRLMRRNRMTLPPPRPRHTTNSFHRYHKYKNLIKGFTPDRANRLWVSDITYIETEEGFCYLHLITDAYSHKIIGWRLSESLKAEHTLEALRDAIARCGGGDLTGLIHHSDRGSQYCCDMYVSELRRHNISISMTEGYKPTDNAIAERANGIIKQELVYRSGRFSGIEQAREAISGYISFYNEKRPHMSIGMNTPEGAHGMSGELKKRWRRKKYAAKASVT